jgi:hypothetical protein
MVPRTSSVVEAYSIGNPPNGGNGNQGSSGALDLTVAGAVAALAVGAGFMLL